MLSLVPCCLLAAAPAAFADPPPSTPPDSDTFLRDYAETRGFMLGRPVNATPTPDGSAVLFLRAKSAREPSQELYEFNVATKETRRLLAPEDALRGAAENLSPEEKARRERQRISVGGFTAFSISKNSALVLLSLSGKLYVLDRTQGRVRALATGPGAAVDPKFSPDSRSVAYVRGDDVYVFNLASGRETAVTTGGTETVSHGLADFVAQEEMARFSGFWWSPDSKRIVFEESDASKVESWYVADPAQPGGEPARAFYPRPGKENVRVRLGIAFVDGSEETVWIEWDHEKYPYLGKVTWGEHGPLTLTVLSRDQTDLALLEADPTWGESSALLTEHDDAWVNLPQDVPVWLSEENGGGFLWASERDGWRALERHANDGRLTSILTPKNDGFLALSGVANGQAFATSNYQVPYNAILNRVPLDGKPAPADAHDTLSLDKPSLVQATLGDCQTILASQEQTLDSMPQVVVRKVADGEIIADLPSVAADPSLEVHTYTAGYATGVPDVESPKNSRYVEAVTWPRNFEAREQRKYPVIVDVYGGPGHQQVVASKRRFLLNQWLADQGFIVVAIDGRGTPGRGRDWERAIAGHFGSVPLDDQVEALKALGAEIPSMDLDRVGITGWSFGGYMSALAVRRRP